MGVMTFWSAFQTPINSGFGSRAPGRYIFKSHNHIHSATQRPALQGLVQSWGNVENYRLLSRCQVNFLSRFGNYTENLVRRLVQSVLFLMPILQGTEYGAFKQRFIQFANVK